MKTSLLTLYFELSKMRVFFKPEAPLQFEKYFKDFLISSASPLFVPVAWGKTMRVVYFKGSTQEYVPRCVSVPQNPQDHIPGMS